MRIGKSITLNAIEQAICKKIAKDRYMVNRKNGVEDKKKGPQSNDETDLEGFAGEFAFCKMFNIFPDLNVKVTSQNDDSGDCIYKKKRVDVKTTSYDTGKLICALWKNDNIDIYVLMVGKFPTYEYRGFATASDLKRKCNIINLGRGPVYAMNQNELNSNITKSIQNESKDL